jgi:hypothetical protein
MTIVVWDTPAAVAAEALKIVVKKNREKLTLEFVGTNGDFKAAKNSASLELGLSFQRKGVTFANKGILNNLGPWVKSARVSGNKIILKLANKDITYRRFYSSAGSWGLELTKSAKPKSTPPAKVKELAKDKAGAAVTEKKTEADATSAVKKEPESSPLVKDLKEPISASILPSPPQVATYTKGLPFQFIVSDDGEGVSIEFATDRKTAAAILRRGGKLWIIFDNRSRYGTKIYDKRSADSASREIVDNWEEETTADQVNTYITAVAEGPMEITTQMVGNVWMIKIKATSRDHNPHSKDLKVVSEPAGTPYPYVAVRTGSTNSHIITVHDPHVGDKFTVLPIDQENISVQRNYEFVDFKVLQTFQGVAVQHNADNIEANFADNSLRITANSGLNIGKKVLQKEQVRYEQEDASNKFADYLFSSDNILILTNLVPPKVHFYKMEGKMRSAFRETEIVDRKSNAMASLAMLYLANDMYAEGVTLMNELKVYSPKFASTYQVKVAAAVLHYMKEEYKEAADIMNGLDITDVPVVMREEAEFWKAILNNKVNIRNYHKVDLVSLWLNQKRFIRGYTDSIKYKLGLDIVSNAMAKEAYQDADPVLDRLLKMDLLPDHKKNTIFYTTAKFHQARREEKEALEFYDKCIADISDTYNRSRCRFAKALYQKELGAMDPKPYAKELSIIAQIWRGDELEREVLKKLGEAYYDQKDYLNALRTWQNIVEYSPNTRDAIVYTRFIGETFYDFYTTDLGQGANPLQALAMFYEFKHLVPIGAKGDKIISTFIDNLIKLNLIDRAAALLEHQIKNRLYGFEREAAINKLAKIYISKGEQKPAIQALLQGYSLEALPDNIQQERRWIKAQALFMDDQGNRAMELLQDDNSLEADEIRADIFWKQQEWRDFASNAEPKVYKLRDQPAQVLNKADAYNILRLATAYIMLDRKDLLKDLFEDFQDRMPTGKYSEVLASIKKILDTFNSETSNSVYNSWEIKDLIKGLNALSQEE